MLQVSADSLSFASPSTSKTFDIRNIGGGTLTWKIIEDYWWLRVSPAEGTTTTETDSVTVFVYENYVGDFGDAFGGTVTVSSNDGDHRISIVAQPVVTNVSPKRVPPGVTLTVFIEGLNLTGAVEVDCGPGISVDCLAENTSTLVTALISVAGAAEEGWRTVSVTGQWGSAVLDSGLYVTEPSSSAQHVLRTGSPEEIAVDALEEVTGVLASELVTAAIGTVSGGLAAIYAVYDFTKEAWEKIAAFSNGTAELHIRNPSDPCGGPALSSIFPERGERVSMYARIYTDLVGNYDTATISISYDWDSDEEPLEIKIPGLQPSRLYYIEFAQEFYYPGFYTVTLRYGESNPSVSITIWGEPPVPIGVEPRPMPGTTVVRNPLTIQVTCPVDLSIVDPEGLVVDKNTNEIAGATYIEADLNGDGALDDLVTIPHPKGGDYQVTVIAQPDASPEDTYSLKVGTVAGIIYSAEEVAISSIPAQPYVLTVAVLTPAPTATAAASPKPPLRGEEGTNVWVVIGPVLGVVAAGGLLYALVKRKGKSEGGADRRQ